MHPYLLIALETSATLVEEIVKSFPKGGYDVRPDPKRFSMREVVAHLADWEPIFLTRLKLAVENPGSTVTVYDEGKVAQDNNYSTQDPVANGKRFFSARLSTVEYLKGITASAFQNQVNHPERGPMRTIDLAHMMVCHDLNHLEQLRNMAKVAA